MIEYIVLMKRVWEVRVLPNIKSAKKRVKVINKKTLRNRVQKSILKTSIRKSREAMDNDPKNAKEAFENAIKSIDKAVSKHILHRNTAARKKSKLAKRFNKVVNE